MFNILSSDRVCFQAKHWQCSYKIHILVVCICHTFGSPKKWQSIWPSPQACDISSMYCVGVQQPWVQCRARLLKAAL